MKVGLTQPFGNTAARNADYLREYSTFIEYLGFDSLWVPEHIVFFDSYDSEYPYNDDGVLNLPADPGHYDPFLALTAAGMVTTRLRLGTSVLLLAERNPLITAREAASVDQLTSGRLLLGVGVGWSTEEYAALGVPWANRGRRCSEYIDVLKELWTTSRSTHRGEFCQFEGVAAFPKPIQRPHPPVIVGGSSEAALRRAARHGDGWYGWKLALDDLQVALAGLEQLLSREGRSREDFLVQTGMPHLGDPVDFVDYARGCERLGLDRLIISVPTSRRDYRVRLEQFALALSLEAAD